MRSSRLVKRDDARAAETEVVLEANTCATDLAPIGAAAQLVRQLEALREAGRAERVDFDSKPPEGFVTTLPP